MRVFGRILVLAALICAAAPHAAGAAPILSGLNALPGAGCGTLVAAATLECQLFSLNPGAPATFEGSFTTAADVALFSFAFTAETRLTVTTSSYPANFDPSFGLFDGGGSIVRFFDASLGDVRSARNFDTNIDTGDYDETLDLVLSSGSYVLALVAWPNDFNGVVETLQAGLACDAEGACDFGDAGNGFTFEMSASAIDGGPAPVPEPGTLTLLAGGLAAAYARRRAKKRA